MSAPVRMRGWNRTIKLKDLLTADESPETVRRVAAALAERLRRDRDYREGSELFDLVDEFDGIANSTAADYAGENETILGHCNDVLSALYDWADAERVWIA